MSAALLAAFARGGGNPPATAEALRVYADGAARAVVGNAWPLGAPQNEAGSYELRLGPDELAELTRLTDAAASPGSSSGPAMADSGRSELELPGGRRATWPMHASAPGDLGPLVDRLRELLTATRRHPLAALTLVVQRTGDRLELHLNNPGTMPVELVPDRLQARATAAEDGTPHAIEIDAAGLPNELAPGADTMLCGRLAEPPAGFSVMLRVDAVVPYEGAPLRLECILRT